MAAFTPARKEEEIIDLIYSSQSKGDDGTDGLPAQAAVAFLLFRRAPAGHVQDWHLVPRRQYVIALSGQGEIEIGDGAVRRFGPGVSRWQTTQQAGATSRARWEAEPRL